MADDAPDGSEWTPADVQREFMRSCKMFAVFTLGVAFLIGILSGAGRLFARRPPNEVEIARQHLKSLGFETVDTAGIPPKRLTITIRTEKEIRALQLYEPLIGTLCLPTRYPDASRFADLPVFRHDVTIACGSDVSILRELRFEGCRPSFDFCCADFPCELSEMPYAAAVKSLRINDHDGGFRHCFTIEKFTGLEELSILESSVDEAFADRLASLPSLKEISLPLSTATRPAADRLRRMKNLTKLELLSISDE
ncbi:MAG: hypothetical protein ACRC1K_13355 [Planctomycetia bacterium]